MAQPPPFATAIKTCLDLIDQYTASLDSSNFPQTQRPVINYPSPSHLLTASATSLKSTVTKLSLLTITTPFTPTAIVSTLQPLNTSILPSLVTATLLTSPAIYPEAFTKECNALTQSSLRNLKALLLLVKVRSENGKPKDKAADSDKQKITEATGKVWEDCDLLVSFSNGGVVDLVCRKAGQWLDLMKDAVKEFEEWDPEEDVGDDPFGLGDAQSGDEEDGANDTEKDTNRAAMSAGVKDQAIKVLSRIPQSVHVVVKQRLAKLPKESLSDPSAPMVPMPGARQRTINKVLMKTRKISDCIDESAEAMYMGDPEMCLKKAGEARALTIEVVEMVFEPWEKSDKETKEDQYIKRALAWIQQVDPGDQQSATKDNAKGKEEN